MATAAAVGALVAVLTLLLIGICPDSRLAGIIDPAGVRQLLAAPEGSVQHPPRTDPSDALPQRSSQHSAANAPIETLATIPALVVANATYIAVPARATTEPAPHDLVRQLQQELRRIGCYSGTLDGDWGPGTIRSIRAFIEHTNSSLPVDQPDLFQLTLLRGHRGIGCNSGGGGVTAATAPAPTSRVSDATPRSAYSAASTSPITTGSIEPLAASYLQPAQLGATASEPSSETQAAASSAARSRNLSAKSRVLPQTATRRQRSWTGKFFE